MLHRNTPRAFWNGFAAIALSDLILISLERVTYAVWLFGGLVTGGLVTGGLVTGGLVTGGLVTGGLVTGGLVTGGLVAGGLVAGGLVTGGLVTGGLVTGGLVTVGLVTGGLVTGGLVTGGLVTGGLVTGGLVTGGLVISEVMTDGVWAVLLSEILTRIAQCRVWVVRPDIDHLASYRQRTGHKLSPVCYGWLQYTTTDCCDDHSL